MSSYWQHKKMSMAMTAVTCGIGAYLSRGTKLSRLGYKVAGPVRAEGGKKVMEMVGRDLARSISTRKIANETLKRVGCKIVEGVAYGIAQGAVDHVSHSSVEYLKRDSYDDISITDRRQSSERTLQCHSENSGCRSRRTLSQS